MANMLVKFLLGFFPGAGTIGFFAMAYILMKDGVSSGDSFTTVSFLLLALGSLAMAVLLGSLTVFIAKLH